MPKRFSINCIKMETYRNELEKSTIVLELTCMTKTGKVPNRFS